MVYCPIRSSRTDSFCFESCQLIHSSPAQSYGQVSEGVLVAKGWTKSFADLGRTAAKFTQHIIFDTDDEAAATQDEPSVVALDAASTPSAAQNTINCLVLRSLVPGL